MSGTAHYEKDAKRHIARITIHNPEKRNALDFDVYRAIVEALNEAEDDDAIKVILLKGSNGTFSTGQDMSAPYNWYFKEGEESRRRPSQTRRLTRDRGIPGASAYHRLYKSNKVVVGQIEDYALGGGLEFALACDITVCAHGTRIGMPATRFLGPVLGNIHLFFYRLGATLAKDLLLTGRIADAAEAADRGVWSRFVPPDQVEDETEKVAAMVGRMPADGIAVAKNIFTLIEETNHLGAAAITETIAHAFATNLQFQEDEYNFVKIRSKVGTSKAFKYRDLYYDQGVPVSELSRRE